MVNSLPNIPLDIDIESKAVLKKLAKAHQALAELKGVAASIPNQSILINTLSLQEAKDSSAIENIITTHDDLYRSDSLAEQFVSVATKEVYNYATALRNGFTQVKQTGLLTNNDILKIHACIEENRAGYRKLSGPEVLGIRPSVPATGSKRDLVERVRAIADVFPSPVLLAFLSELEQS